jgi:signal transduction histidine kinase
VPSRRSFVGVGTGVGTARPRPVWQRYGAAVVIIVAVVAGRLALDPWWGRQHNRHLVFLPAVMLAAWLGGFGPGIMATAGTTIALALFWTTAQWRPAAVAELLLFVGMGVAVSGLIRSLQLARDRSEAAKQSREQVLAIVAHDLRNPLTTIKMTSGVLRRIDTLGDLAQKRLEVIDRAASRMDDLIRDLLDAERIEHTRLSVEVRPENIQLLAREALDLAGPMANERGVLLDVRLPADEVVVGCDRGRLLQLLGNLLGNAIRFTPAGGRVTLRVEPGEHAVSFAVDDTGAGIKPEHLGHVFERHWNTDSSGVGLGLYIARSIVRGHGGTIGVRSDLGRGTSFFFDIPR